MEKIKAFFNRSHCDCPFSPQNRHCQKPQLKQTVKWLVLITCVQMLQTSEVPPSLKSTHDTTFSSARSRNHKSAYRFNSINNEKDQNICSDIFEWDKSLTLGPSRKLLLCVSVWPSLELGYMDSQSEHSLNWSVFVVCLWSVKFSNKNHSSFKKTEVTSAQNSC